MSENTTKTFTVTEDGREVTYKRTGSGWCGRDGRRISAKAFATAEEAWREQAERSIGESMARADAVVERADRDLTAEEMEELFDLRANKLMSWYELAQRYGVSERRVRQAFEFVRKLDAETEDVAAEVVPEVPEPEAGDTEVTYSDEPVPPRPEFEIPGVDKSQASVGHVNGHEYVHDWFGRRYFRDGVEITKGEFDREVHGAEAPETGKGGKEAPRRARRPRDVAGTYETSEGTVTLTAKQKRFLTDLSSLGEDDLLGNVHGGVWCDVMCDVMGTAFDWAPMSVGAMLSTICEKGLGERHKERRDGTGKGKGKLVTVFRLTGKGGEVWEAMRS